MSLLRSLNAGRNSCGVFHSYQYWWVGSTRHKDYLTILIPVAWSEGRSFGLFQNLNIKPPGAFATLNTRHKPNAQEKTGILCVAASLNNKELKEWRDLPFYAVVTGGLLVLRIL